MKIFEFAIFTIFFKFIKPNLKTNRLIDVNKSKGVVSERERRRKHMSKVCNACGWKTEKDAKFCENCGGALEEIPNKKPKAGKKKIFIGICYGKSE